MLYIAIVLGVCLIAVIYKNWVGRAGEQYLIDLYHLQEGTISEQQKTIELMEQGRTEQEENYEMQFLTFQERIEHLDEQIQSLHGDIYERDRAIEELTEMCKDQQIDLDMHDTKCLPDIEMMRWQALSMSIQNA